MGARNQICNICGNSVVFGSGRFVNRIPDFNSITQRMEIGRSFPQGDFICAECDSEIRW